jgi:endonuclease I
MYLRIDRIDGQVKGIYTNYSLTLPDGVDPSTHLYQNGSSNGINCEHVWPQSLYEGGEPIKSDMHALRPCKNNVNTSRGNKPFGENPDSQTDTWYWLSQSQTSIPTSNIDEYSESETVYFEPREDRKGDIARTMFYFYTMYSEVADGDFFEGQKEVLKTWHELDSADEEEIIRTWQIAFYQQNKPNPFILDETLIERAYFYDGILIGDLNEDGLLNILDLVMLVNIILYDENGSPAADVNGDGTYNVLDVVMLANIILSQN